uniref:Peptidase A1 domain-containing protein n=1 Tax=Lotus japonicus TaxID=34305 RepID=I3SG45_LOTJA|nr:unknown [Lotus japonicus]
MHALAFFFAASCSLLATLPFTEPSKTPSSFTIDLIHHDSPPSPFYNSSMTRSQLIRNAAMRSISRANQLSLSLSHSLNQLKESSPEPIIIPNNGNYLMRIYIGTPSVERLAIADTGSDLTWVQCSPCDNTKCFAQNTPLYDPLNSSTFTLLPCDSQPCTQLPYSQYVCSDYGDCIYAYTYGDNSYSYGGLSSDSIRLMLLQLHYNSKICFGCGFQNKFTADKSGKTTGIVGLGAGPLSLVSQLGDEIGHKFSYCLLPFSSNSNSKLKFGEAAIVQGNGVVSTPLIIKPDLPFYYLNLEGITVGAKTVKTGQTDGNIIIDSGSTLTYLEESFYNEFVSLVKETVAVEEDQYIPYPFDFCFTYKEGMSTPPDVVFHFTGGDVVLKPMNTLVLIEDNLICSTVVPSHFDGIAIFGNLGQIDFHVGYDIQGGKVSFAPTDCSLN